jgi:hypothetical protein
LFFVETRSSAAGDAFVRWVTSIATSNNNNINNIQNQSLATRINLEDVENIGQTPDELRVAGFDNAIMAETCGDAVKAQGWLDKALYCFQQVGDTALAAKARAHRSSVYYRATLLESSDASSRNVDDLEMDAARIVKSLMSENLLIECRLLCESIMPLLPDLSQQQLQSRILVKLPSREDLVV